MEQEAYRHVPYDIDVEQALLGAILADNRAMERASALIKPEHFYDPLHGRIGANRARGPCLAWLALGRTRAYPERTSRRLPAATGKACGDGPPLSLFLFAKGCV